MAVLEIPLFCFPQPLQIVLSQRPVHLGCLRLPPPRQSHCCPPSTFRQPLHCRVLVASADSCLIVHLSNGGVAVRLCAPVRGSPLIGRLAP